MLVKKNIIIDDKTWDQLKIFSQLHKNMSISNVIRDSVEKFIKEIKKTDLAFKMRMMTEEVDEDEQMEIEQTLEKMSVDDLKSAETIDL